MQDMMTALYQYCDEHSKGLDALLHRLERATHLETTQPRMLSGMGQGLFLQMISMVKRPVNILEIGTFTGYSALCLAAGLAENGKLTTIDINPETLEIAKKYIAQSSLKDQIIVIEGHALEVIPQLEGDFDLVFIDADKENYPEYYNMVRPRVPSGGMIILDNMLWSGKVLDKTKDKRTQILDDVNKLIAKDDGVINLLLPIRDGLHLLMIK